VRWPWRRRKVPHVNQLPTADLEAAELAKRDALVIREQVEARNGYIDWLHNQLTAKGAENHFSEMIIESMRRKRS
jgi:hypothetical protein